jgi:hypothetical protein
LSGFVIFSVLGYMAELQGKDVDSVAGGGGMFVLKDYYTLSDNMLSDNIAC